MDRIQKGYYGYQFVPEVLSERLASLRAVIPAGSRLIDLGCNDGTISKELIKSGHAASSLGIDFEDIRVDPPEEFDFLAVDLRSFDLSTLPPADIVLCLNLVHHLSLHGIDFIRNFMRRLSRLSGTVIFEMGSLTARIDANWLKALRAEWASDLECRADLFAPFAWRHALMSYPFQFGRRVLWKLVSDREDAYEFDALGKPVSEGANAWRLRRRGTHEFFSAKPAPRTPELAHLQSLIHAFLKDRPFDSILPLTIHPDYGVVYGFDPEVASTKPITLAAGLTLLSPAAYREMLRFAAQTVPACRNMPLDMLCDFKACLSSRGLTFYDFEPKQEALSLLSNSN